MATAFRRGSSPDIRPFSKYRFDHDRQTVETSRWRDSHIRKPQSERHRERSTRRSPPRQTQRPSPYQLPTPMSTPSSSTLSLNAQVEHNRSVPMERTPSGNSIIHTTYEPPHDHHTLDLDEVAALHVVNHFKRRPPYGKQERYLWNLIVSPVPIDDDALDGVRAMVDAVFFDGYLAKRVTWEWSSESDERYRTELIGTSALRHAANESGGYETLIVLSKPILKHPDYDRRLVLSAFIHELIHCYLFIRCGFNAKMKGGHTKGFHSIAEIIDNWVGPENNLRLCNMEANLNHFRRHQRSIGDHLTDIVRDNRHIHEDCNPNPRSESRYEDTGLDIGY